MSHRDPVDGAAGRRARRGRLAVDPDRRVRGRGARRSTASSSTRRSCTRPTGMEILKNFLYGVADAPPPGRRRRSSRVEVERIRAQVGSEPCALRTLGRRRLGGRRAARPQGGRRPAHVRLRRPRPAAQGRGAAGRRDVRAPLPRAARPRRRGGALPVAPRGRRRPRAKAEAHRRGVHPRLRGGGAKLGEVPFLVQGTLYSGRDRVGRAADGVAATIKSHHNVGGLPEDVDFELVEPLRMLFKDEVRRVGEELGLPEAMVWRQPFPGPGLGDPDHRRGHPRSARHRPRGRRDPPGGDPARRPLPRPLAVLLRAPGDSLGRVQGDSRTYAYPIVIRAVTSEDAMTADWARLPYELLETHLDPDHQRDPGGQPRRLDLSSKPPATIEWE